MRAQRVVSSALLWLFVEAFAAPMGRANLVAESTQVEVSTVRREAVETSLRLVADETVTENLVITPSDLVVEDGSARIPASAIKFEGVDLPLAANQAQVLKISIADEALRDSGEFTGGLLVQYGDRSQLIPMTLRVKSPAWTAWPVIILGVFLGTLLSLYREAGLPRDELVVKVGELRTQMKGEAEVAAARFKAGAESELLAVEIALGNRNWQAAETSLAAAQGIWTRWRAYRADWILQLGFLGELAATLAQENGYHQAIATEVETIRRQIATYETPEVFAEKLSPLRDQLVRYQRCEEMLKQMSELLDQVSDRTQENAWKRTLAQLEDRLAQLPPADEQAMEAWKVKVESRYDELTQLVEMQAQETSRGIEMSPAESMPRGLMRELSFGTGRAVLRPVPTVVGGPSLSVRRSRWNLSLFRWGSKIVLIGLISWLGMAELYEQEAAFGARPIGNYLGLFAWGFGAEVSRDAIVSALGNLRGAVDEE